MSNWPHPEHPLIEGRYKLTNQWLINLPQQFNRRIEDKSLVLWRPGVTFWMNIWGNTRNETQAQQLTKVKKDSSKERFRQEERIEVGITRYSYHLIGDHEEGPVYSIFAFIFNDYEHIQLTCYYDDAEDEESIHDIINSIVCLINPQESETVAESKWVHTEFGTKIECESNHKKIKKYAIDAAFIEKLVPHDGGCIATDKITVDGRSVGYMYREETDKKADTGWRFFAGDESQDYISDNNNSSVYSVNTIANYDADIIKYLDTPPPCGFERIPGKEGFFEINE
jgi:hypothetical protein